MRQTRRQRGGQCGMPRKQSGGQCEMPKRQAGGGCPCAAGGSSWFGQGGYRATRKNKALLARLRRGESIGFTATASLKAKGLIPRTSRKYRGKKVLGPKYR
jgi:hypothetical protein